MSSGGLHPGAHRKLPLTRGGSPNRCHAAASSGGISPAAEFSACAAGLQCSEGVSAEALARPSAAEVGGGHHLGELGLPGCRCFAGPHRGFGAFCLDVTNGFSVLNHDQLVTFSRGADFATEVVRLLSGVSSLVSVGYNGLMPKPLKTHQLTSIAWSCAFAALHLVNFALLLRETRGLKLSEEEEDIYEHGFQVHGVTPRQFRKLLDSWTPSRAQRRFCPRRRVLCFWGKGGQQSFRISS